MIKAVSHKLYNKIGCQILRMVHKLHFYFQRQLLMRFYEKKCSCLKEEKSKRSRRQMRFYNNKLVKQYMIENDNTIGRHSKHKITKKGRLIDKAFKIDRVKGGIKF